MLKKPLPPGNIWSGSRSLAWLTNPTVIAKRKGNVRGDYPIKYLGETFPDVETAYQELKVEYDCLGQVERMELCTELIIIKLETYPQIADAITLCGGVEWLTKCTHFVGYNKTEATSPWEGVGVNSDFIKCLITAYEHVTE